MLIKKIAILASAALVTLGFLTVTNVASAHEHFDDRYHHDGYYHHHHFHDHCRRVVYHQVCHGPWQYKRCHMVRSEYHC